MAAARPWALVTGGAKRVGRGLVEAVADAGYAVAVHVHRSIDEGRVVVAGLECRGVPGCVVAADLADQEACATLIRDLAARGRAPSLLVNNAAIFEPDRLADVTAAGFERHMAINLGAPLLLSRAFAEHLPEGHAGHIVNVVDQRVVNPTTTYLTYTLAKSALWSLTRILALDLAPRIRVNAIAPGMAMPDVGMAPETAQRIVERFPLGIGGGVDDLAATLRFLVDTPSITGEMICVDGGAHLSHRAP